MQSFDIEDTITIKEGQDITLIADNQEKADDTWQEIEQPSDYANKGEKKQREIIEDARKRGDEAINKANDGKVKKEGEDFHYNFDGTEIIIKRSNTLTGTMFEVIGNLKLGDDNSSINFDGNKKSGSFFNVQNGGDLTLKNGVIANSKNSSAPIQVNDDGNFTMDGGRITSNVANKAGAVYVARGGTFTMENGMIDHNIADVGAVYVGNYSSSTSDTRTAIFNLSGGSIVSNKTKGFPLAGAIGVFTKSEVNITGGIIAGNYSKNYSGGITVSDRYINDWSNTPNNSYSNTEKMDYDEFIKYNKTEVNFKGGLLYKNESGYAGGAVFVDSNNVKFIKTMILDNKATKFGGGVYISVPPRVQELENILITENKAPEKTAPYTNNDSAWGGPNVGGGIWNCPDGYIHIGDGHSIYVFNNNANKGADYVFSKKTNNYKLNDTDISGQFYSFVSPVTEGNNIIKFLNDSGKGSALPKNMSYTDQFVYLKAIYNEALQKEAWKNSGTFILGNQASYGSGLGSDTSIISNQDKGNVEFKFKKHWDEDINEDYYRWLDIHADIYIVPEDVDEVYVRSQYGYDNRLFKYGEVILNHDNNWEATFGKFKNDKYKNLPAFTMDKGLPFTNEELAERGLKYLVIERETVLAEDKGVKIGFISEVEKIENGGSKEVGKVTITRDKSVEQADADENNAGADFYFFELNKDGSAKYIGKSNRLGDNTSINSEFSHPILNNTSITEIVYYGDDRYLVEKGGESLENMEKGFPENSEKYSIFIEKVDGGIKLYLPYIWTQKFDSEENNSGLKVAYNSIKEVEPTSYEFIINNRPTAEAKIEKKWKMLTEEEIREALGEYREDVEVKNRELPDQVTFYVLKDGKKIIVDYYRDEEGKVYPVYKTVTVTKKNDWKGVITKLDPKYLAKGSYGIEEKDLEGFEMDYEIKKVLVNEDELKAYEEKLKKGNPIKIEFRFKKNYHHYYIDDADIDKQQDVVISHGFIELFGDVNVNLFVDGKKVETQTMKWKTSRVGKKYLDNDNIVFGQDPSKPIIIDAKWNHVKVVYYNHMKNDVGNKDLEVNMYLEQDENGVYTFYIPNIMEKGHFVELFLIEETQGDDYFPETIYDFNPDAKPLAEIKPIYEYIFVATNEELPPEPPEPNEPEPRKTFVRVNKVWEALGETRDIQVELYINGKASGKYLTLNAANNWSASFTNLDIDDGMGNLYVYTIKEVGEKDKIYNIDERKFEVSYSGDMYKGFTILNKEVPPEEPEEPEEEEPHEPEEENEKPQDKNRLPKTGVIEDALGIFLGLMILLGLVYIKKKYIVEKTK
ncbi:MAG: Cna B-type domain-containing protein [Eubacteriales bacterium]|uniref:Cna B-type domain-containing protein n=1 Tax=Fenollaria sp. TaxID=1965292 RepID=UPI002A74FDC3|nr:Cna B-type domain-containing protein [Fenollaria sp.]MDD7339427.1 Cna B-type domain-containing protein [Eubacteriales bacterium]MDD7463604.1 Cna B-type domain-containing protein [Peptoniphilaceae bacterium]MDY3055190.1 Cna B-type domain-containing protein [Anaerococcus sp.]MDY3105259.1 Cna B-type domain-containing protein [Fenollaria sp.]